MKRIADSPLEFGKLAMCAADYNEFICSKSTAEWLVGGGMTHLDGKPVYLQQVDELVGGHNVILKIWERHEAA